jgi:tape measure domain-containing protein
MADTNLRVIISAELKKFERAMSRAEKRLDSFGNNLGKIGAGLTASISVPIGLAGAKALKTAAQFEKLQMQLNVLEGSAAKGAKSFERLVKFSAATPFQLDELVKANNTLLGFGVSSETAFESLKAIGDIAAISGGDMQGITVAFGQAAAAGRLMGQDLLQLVNNGVPIIDLLAESMGVAKNEIKEMVSEGAVTFDVLLKAFKDATSDGGKFQGGMQKLSKTLSGLASTLQDNVNIAFAELGKALVEDYDLINNTERLTENIQKITEGFKEMNPETRKFYSTLTLVAGVVPLVLTAVAGLAKVASIAAGGAKILSKGLRLIGSNIVVQGIMLAVNALDMITKAIAPNLNFFERMFKVLENFSNAADPFGVMAMSLQSSVKPLAKLAKESKEARAAADEAFGKPVEIGVGGLPFGRDDKVTMPQIKDEDTSPMLAAANAQAAAIDEMLASDSKLTYALATGEASQKSFANHVRNTSNTFRELKETTEEAKEEFDQLSSILSEAAAGALTGLGEALGNAMAGIGGLAGNMGEVLGGAFSQLLIDVGKAAIKIGAAIAGIKKALESLNPAVAIAAGVALVGLGTYFKNRMQKSSEGIKAFANGGIISGPTLGLMGEYAGAKSNPEVVAPLDRLKNLMGNSGSNVNVAGEFRVQGQDLVVALERANKQRNNFL